MICKTCPENPIFTVAILSCLFLILSWSQENKKEKKIGIIVLKSLQRKFQNNIIIDLVESGWNVETKI